MKKILLLLMVPVLTLAQENQKIPNFFPELSMAHSTPENLDMPSTNWADISDISWYSDDLDVFEISTAEEFAGLAQVVISGQTFEGKTISLMSDVDLGAHLWLPVGTGVTFPFSGSFNGNNYTVSNLNINLPQGDFIGMFGHVVDGYLENIKLENATVYGLDTVGSIVSNLYGSSISNCHANNVTVVATSYNIGGLAGGLLSGGVMENCSATNVNVTGVNQVGGLLGTIWDAATVKKSYSTGEISGDYILGGLIGFTTFAFSPGTNKVENCFSRVNVTGNNGRVGGFYGMAQASIIIENSYSTGTATANELEGGFVGIAGNIITDNNYFDFESSQHIAAVGGWEGQAQDPAIYGRDTDFMKTQAFVDELNLNAEDGPIWFMGEEWNDFYPILSGSLDVNDITQKVSSIKIYPNPVVNELHLKSAHPIQGVELYDVNGKLLKTMKSADKISVSHLPKGVYFVKIRSNNTIHFEKFIKK